MRKLTSFATIAFVLALSSGLALAQSTYTWDGSASGDWSAGWSSGYPNAAGDTANVGNSADITIDVADALMNHLNLTGATNTWTIGGTNPLTFSDYDADASGALSDPERGTLYVEGTLNLNAELQHAGSRMRFTGPGTIHLNGGMFADTGMYRDLVNGTVVINSNVAGWFRNYTGGTVRIGADADLGGFMLDMEGGILESTPEYNVMEMSQTDTTNGRLRLRSWGAGGTFAAVGTDFTLAWGGLSTLETVTLPTSGTMIRLGGATSDHTTIIKNDVLSDTIIGLYRVPGVLTLKGGGNAIEGIIEGDIISSVGATEGDVALGGSGTLVVKGSSSSLAGDIFIGGESGVVRLANANALANQGTVVFGLRAAYSHPGGSTGAVIENSSQVSEFTRNLGTGAGEVMWGPTTSHRGGFSAYEQDFTVAIGGTASPTLLVWAGDGGVTSAFAAANQHNHYTELLFGSERSTHTVLFKNDIQLGARRETSPGSGEYYLIDGERWFNVAKGTTDAPEVDIQGDLSDNYQWGGENKLNSTSVNKTGPGTLVLSGNNTFHGGLKMYEGVVRINGANALPTDARYWNSDTDERAGTAVYMAAGAPILEGSANYTSFTAVPTTWGSSSFAIRFDDNLEKAGFSAYGADFTVNIGGSGAKYTWAGVSNYMEATTALLFNSDRATHTVRWVNPIQLTSTAAGSRTVEVTDGLADIDAEMQGALSEGFEAPGSLIKTGLGTLELSADNTYTGLTDVTAGRLMLSGSVAGDVSVAVGSVLAGSGTVGGDAGIAGALEVALAPTDDGLNIVGALNLSSATDSLALNGTLETGVDYTLASYGTLSGTFEEVFLNDVLVADLTAIGGTHELVYDANALQLLAATVAITGDVNGDGIVDYQDLGIMAGNWNMTSGADLSMGDLNGDGAVDYQDLGIMAGNWNYGVTATGTVVPEPATMGLLAIGGIAALIRRRRS
jgi:autotransporter-associated beta strand protein